VYAETFSLLFDFGDFKGGGGGGGWEEGGEGEELGVSVEVEFGSPGGTGALSPGKTPSRTLMV
jgi:hypothetical protein